MFLKSFACKLKELIYIYIYIYKGSDLLEDIKRLCEKNGIEESIITIARTLKKKIIDTFQMM